MSEAGDFELQGDQWNEHTDSGESKAATLRAESKGEGRAGESLILC